jgi:site-specific recombinase XerD
MTPLRQRLLEDMKMRNLSPHTQEAYLRAVAKFAQHFGKSPDQLGREDIRAYLLALIQRGSSWSLYNQVRCALHFFYRVTLKKDWPREEIQLLGAIRNLKHRAMLTTLYATGLRASELLALLISDIDSQRMVLRVQQGKGQKDRYVMLSPRLLELLRQYWRVSATCFRLRVPANPGLLVFWRHGSPYSSSGI